MKTLFDFSYTSTNVSVVDLRAEILGFSIVWKLRIREKDRERRRETRNFLKNRISYLKRIKSESPSSYKRAYELCFLSERDLGFVSERF